MNSDDQSTPPTVTRRNALKLAGLAAGGAALAGSTSDGCTGPLSSLLPSQRNLHYASLLPFHPGEKLDENDMRITFLGTTPLPRITQSCNSVFVELGNGESFVFDCGTGVMPKYYAMNIGLRKMDKVFLTHLHGDHVSDLIFIYGFGPSDDRRTPLYVWGPEKSGVPDPVTAEVYEDGTIAFCENVQKMMRWHNESQSFLASSLASYTPPAWAPQDKTDAYDLVAFEVPWNERKVCYEDPEKGVTITSFPAVHCRQGSVSYKLEWNGLSMIFTGDTKPNYYVIDEATAGVDVLIHEMVVPVDVWAERAGGADPNGDQDNWNMAVHAAQEVQDSSHTPQRALGYILSQLENRPRLAVGTHFQAEDDTINAAMRDIRDWYPHGDFIVASDLMVINVSKNRIEKRRGVVSEFTWQPPTIFDRQPGTPKYSSPTAQLDPNARIIDPALWEGDPEKA